MPKSSTPLTKHTLFLREGDFSFLRERFPNQPTSIVVRRVVASFVDKLNRPISPEAIAALAQEVSSDE